MRILGTIYAETLWMRKVEAMPIPAYSDGLYVAVLTSMMFRSGSMT